MYSLIVGVHEPAHFRVLLQLFGVRRLESDGCEVVVRTRARASVVRYQEALGANPAAVA